MARRTLPQWPVEQYQLVQHTYNLSLRKQGGREKNIWKRNDQIVQYLMQTVNTDIIQNHTNGHPNQMDKKQWQRKRK